MCRNAAPVNSPPLLWIQHDGQGYLDNQLFSNNMLICLDILLLIHIISARLVTVSMHINAWKVYTWEPIVTCYGPIRSMAISNHVWQPYFVLLNSHLKGIFGNHSLHIVCIQSMKDIQHEILCIVYFVWKWMFVCNMSYA